MLHEVEAKGNKSFDVKLNENKGGFCPFLSVESTEGVRKIPIFSIRNPKHRAPIARSIVSGHVGVLEAGVMGVLIAVPNNPSVDNYVGKKFWEVKRGRGSSDKVPVMMLPENHDEIVDYSKIHPDFAYLKYPEKRHEFFGKYPFHTILPVLSDVILNRDVFVTTPEDSQKKPQDQWVSEPTVCIFFPGGDGAWENVAKIARDINPDVHLGVSSLNDHGEQPPYNLDQLVSFINRKQRVDFDFIIQDPISRAAQIKSSHTQIRLPFKSEAPEIIIIRDGSVSPGKISEHTGHPVKILESVRFASHGHPENIRLKGLDDRINQYLKEANS